MHEILTPGEMAEADRLAIERGPHDGFALMRNAGNAVARVVLQRYPQFERVHIICGPGNNGGDGYAVGAHLHECGVEVAIWASAPPKAGADAARAAEACHLSPRPLAEFQAGPNSLVIDALFGAGLSRPVAGDALRAIEHCRDCGATVVAVDLPSGVSGETGEVLGQAMPAHLTVTFVRKKYGHVLLPGLMFCGELVVADIGVGDDDVAEAGPRCQENGPHLWRGSLPVLSPDTHKYRRGHVGVFSGGPTATGAARLAAMAAARAGAGAVTVLSPGNALAVNAMQLTAIMLRKAGSLEETMAFMRERNPQALVYGPGLPVAEPTARTALDLLAASDREATAIVFDASALTALADSAPVFFEALGATAAPRAILTPHGGEFARLFPDIAGDDALSKIAKTRAAAERASAVVVYKGFDTVIASPDGNAAVNTNGTPLLATAGSGDVLSGLIAGLAAQGMPAFEAACAAVWMHAEAARRVGPGLIAEDLPSALPPVLAELFIGQPAP